MRCILLIENDSSLRESLTDLLETQSFHVLGAENGLIGTALHQKHPVDLVVTDLSVPKMDGLAVIKALLQQAPETKIIAMSGGHGDSREDALEEARRLGARLVFEKPFNPRELLDAIRRLLA